MNSKSSADHFRDFVDKTQPAIDTSIAVVSNIGQFLIVFLSLHTLFWSIEKFYHYYCIGHGLSGWLYSMVSTQSMVCTGLRKVSDTTATATANAMFSIITWVGLKLVQSKEKGDCNKAK